MQKRPRGGWQDQTAWIGPLLGSIVVAVVVFLVLGAGALWLRQQTALVQTTEAQANALATRAAAAEARAVLAEASLTAIAREKAAAEAQRAAATATAAAQVADPKAGLERALNLVLAAYREPTEARVDQLGGALSPSALAIFRPELDHLQSTRRRLAGESGFEMEVLDTRPGEGDRAEVQTRERWTFDEYGPGDQRARCLREESQQTYSLRRQPSGWLVESIQLITSRREPC